MSVSMFDNYRPARQLQCPVCGQPLRAWQGKDGPNGLFVWVEGVPAPTEQEVDTELQIPELERQMQRLPALFSIYSDDCPDHQPIEAVCRAIGGVWASTVVQSFHSERTCEPDADNN
jgi:hypothetical protein